MKILILGGTRFIGPRIVNILKKEHELAIFNRGNIQTEYGEGRKYIRGDRNSDFDIQDQCDVVIDTSAWQGAQTRKVIDQIDFDFIMHLSTIAVYKKSDSLPISENSPIGYWPFWGNYS